ncbi:tRNA uridine 5-oxyacetic acid(34) methyltransferase CmoM [Serratia symbiotica]|uniref:tRNA uridine 5-oxyacetic acid(34) methyltransferase CmoM n=1 Tax=Serratia symbiotica TaxID=138074 RepID=UPI00209143EE|nr:tRNA uridine 5-oxyacetic acid(34) methyltransferase CmoM [Serratia symbiotica]USS96734.1 tRNA uridine 5-oxyacetic acid(34) methyltransferase CmoM [Serratia symbiotica]
MQDRNFDDIAEKFAHNIYGTTKGKIRQAVVWQDLTTLLAQLPQRSLRILDAGGGEGHVVVLCDLSGEMIQRAAQLAEQKGVSQNMQFIQSSAQEIAQHLAQPVDLILFHAVLEWIAEPEAALQQLFGCLLPGGALSLMFFNANGLVMRNAVLGNFQLVDPVVRRRRKRSLSPQHPQQPLEVYGWLEQLQVYGWLEQMRMRISGKTGVRVFHGYLQSRQLQTQKFEQLLALEQHYSRQEPYVSLGRYIHVMARKPNLKDEL